MDPKTKAILKARLANCKFIEHIFPTPPVDRTIEPTPLNFQAPETLTLNPDPRTALADTEVTKLINLKDLADQIPDGFYSGPRVLQNPLPGTCNVLPTKRLAPLTSKSTKVQRTTFNTEVALDPTSLAKAKASPEWPDWSKALETEYTSLRKHQVFGEVSTKLTKPPVGYKLIFSRIFDTNGKLLRFKVHLVAQGFSQRPGEDFDQTYSPVLDITSFRYLLAFAVHFGGEIFLMDVITSYLYGNLDMLLYISPPPDFLPRLPTPSPEKFLHLRICKALYGLKEAGKMWYHVLQEFLISHGFLYDPALPCIFTLN